jgi:pimeloyl-ACP methyl ester carboxylesterase
MGTARVNDIDIYYEVHGTGPPLLLIMGLGANATAWEMQITELRRQFQVIAYDNRGAGRSDKPDEPYSMCQMADDAAGLLDALGIVSAHVFGMSMGGMIAQELVLRHPDRVRALILGGTMAGGPAAIMAGPQLMLQWARLATMPPAQAIEAGLTFLYSDEFLSQNRDRLVQRALETMHLMAPPYALRRQVMAIIGFNTHSRLRNIRAAALILTGTADKIVPAENSRALAARIPSARLIEFPGAGHGFLVEKAHETNAAVLEFLQTHGGPPAGAK